MTRVLVLIVTLAALSGCTLLSTANSNVTLAVQTAVEFGTAEYIQQAGSAAQQLARAQQLSGIVTELEGIDTGTVTVAQFQAQMQADIAKLSVPEQVIATAALTIVVNQLNLRVQNGILSSSLTAAVNAIFNDMLAVCKDYSASG